ncbi:MAG: hypothetical protein ACREUZ_06015 [Burkholderiales bacterium]
MTPDERAERAECVIRETYRSFVNAAAWLREEFNTPAGSAVRALEICAHELACHARIAGISIDEAPR